MIVGIGVDVLKVDKLHSSYLSDTDPFLLKTYTKKEIESAHNSQHEKHYFADRYAGKEAVFKALQMSDEHVLLSDIEILNNENGIPYVVLHGKVKTYADRKGITTIHISLSFDDDLAIAYAIAEKNEKGE